MPLNNVFIEMRRDDRGNKVHRGGKDVQASRPEISTSCLSPPAMQEIFIGQKGLSSESLVKRCTYI